MKSGPAKRSPEERTALDGIGARVARFRRLLHLTQTELARRVGMRPGPVNCIEHGRNLPSLAVAVRLAHALGVPLEALLGDAPQPYVREAATPYGANAAAVSSNEPAVYRVPLRRPDFRSPPGGLPCASPVHLLPAAVSYPDDLLETLEELVHAYLTLEDLCGATRRASIPLCLAMPHTEAGIEDLAMRVRGLLGVGPAVIFDYLELFENAGLRVVFAPLPGAVASAACHDPQRENAFLFVTTAARPTSEHQLFRLVCELGRIYCHTGQVQQVEGRTKPLDAEHVAAKFTAFFLMPAEAVHASVRQVGVKYAGWSWEMLLRLKHRFGVSAETFLDRLGELDLIAPGQLTDLKSRLQAHYAAAGRIEPDGSRRILSPNGRLGDLALEASARATDDDTRRELAAMRHILRRHGVKAGLPMRSATSPATQP